MRRKSFIFGGVALAVVVVGYYFVTRFFVPSSVGAIELVNLPSQYCPTVAQVVVATAVVKNPTIISDSNATVTNCRTISLASILGSSNSAVSVWLKLPQSLAEKIMIDSPTATYQVSPTLGDVNGDNVINEVDQHLVEGALLTTTPAPDLDVDGDKLVTVIDMGLVRINYGVGRARPDGKSWGKNG